MNRNQLQLDARLTMPQTQAGHVMSLFYVPKRQLENYEAQWGVWLKAHPRHLWPAWVPMWIEKRRQEQAQE